MFYLFILESIGTSELVLIGLVALIVFGPRQLPELARKFGKAMNEFRRSTDDFKKTWEQEVNFESEVQTKSISNPLLENTVATENHIERDVVSVDSEVAAPEIKELNQADFEESVSKNARNLTKPKATTAGKQDWL